MFKNTRVLLIKSLLKIQNWPILHLIAKILLSYSEILLEELQLSSFLPIFLREDLRSKRRKKIKRMYHLHQLRMRLKLLKRRKWTTWSLLFQNGTVNEQKLNDTNNLIYKANLLAFIFSPLKQSDMIRIILSLELLHYILKIKDIWWNKEVSSQAQSPSNNS